MRFFFSIFLLTIVQGAFLVKAQTLAPNFTSPIPVRAADIKVIKTQSDGKILLGGDITFFDNTSVHNLVRITSDGELDKTFDFQYDANFQVIDIDFLSTGDIIVLAQKWDGDVLRKQGSLLKLDKDGKIKSSIDTLSSYCTSIAIQNDDKILVSRRLSAGQDNLIRYNADLTSDESFNGKIFVNGAIYDVQTTDDKIFICGPFSEINDIKKNDVAKLNLDGTIDSSFDTGEGTDNVVGSITVLPGGKIFLGKTSVDSYDGEYIYSTDLIRLNSDGSLDESFQASGFSSIVSDVIVKNDTVFFASFINDATEPQGFVRKLIKLLPDGSSDPDFAPFRLRNVHEVGVAMVGNDVLIGGSASVWGLDKIDKNGSPVLDFDPRAGRYGTLSTADYEDGDLFVGGDFITLNGWESYGIAKVNEDGSIDETFKYVNEVNSVHQIEILGGQKLLVSRGNKLLKLDYTGSIDPSFVFEPFKPLFQVEKFIVLHDGKIMAGNSSFIYRLNTNGSEDGSFNFNHENNLTALTSYDFDIQGDQVIWALAYDDSNGTRFRGVVRVNQDGSLDETFDTGGGLTSANDHENYISLVKTTRNNEIIAAGTFDEIDGVSNNIGALKLSPNGKPDTAFAKIEGYPYVYNCLEEFGDKVILGSWSLVYAARNDGSEYKAFSVPELQYSYLTDIVPANKYSLFIIGRHYQQGINHPVFISKVYFNDKPVIKKIKLPVEIQEDSFYEVRIDSIVVYDGNNTFPDDFSFSINDGEHYATNGSVIIPDENYNGSLQVSLFVYDGFEDSEPASVEINVAAVNDPPVIAGLTRELTTLKDQPFTFSIDDFVIEDPDNESDDFSIELLEGNNYQLDGSMLIPDNEFLGDLSVSLLVSDGDLTSDLFTFNLAVVAISGIDEGTTNVLMAYPIPTESILYVTLDQSDHSRVEICDITGAVVCNPEHTREKIGGKMLINVGDLKPGVFILKLISEDGIKTCRFVKY